MLQIKGSGWMDCWRIKIRNVAALLFSYEGSLIGQKLKACLHKRAEAQRILGGGGLKKEGDLFIGYRHIRKRGLDSYHYQTAIFGSRQQRVRRRTSFFEDCLARNQARESLGSSGKLRDQEIYGFYLTISFIF
ncbi:hypothetical protein HanIR_Chr02g0085251 [Helianthus annuus]|nr:hypothetical protein HanIR_Chr02g0085251 [Helianthus annuus]